MLNVIFTLAVIGVIVYFLEHVLPISEPFKLGIRIIAALYVLAILFQMLGTGVGVSTGVPIFRIQ